MGWEESDCRLSSPGRDGQTGRGDSPTMAPEHTASLLDRFAKATHKLSFTTLPPTLEASLELNSPSAGSCGSQLFLPVHVDGLWC